MKSNRLKAFSLFLILLSACGEKDNEVPTVQPYAPDGRQIPTHVAHGTIPVELKRGHPCSHRYKKEFKFHLQNEMSGGTVEGDLRNNLLAGGRRPIGGTFVGANEEGSLLVIEKHGNGNFNVMMFVCAPYHEMLRNARGFRLNSAVLSVKLGGEGYCPPHSDIASASVEWERRGVDDYGHRTTTTTGLYFGPPSECR